MSDIEFPDDFSDYLIGEKYPVLKAENSRTNASASLNMISQARHTIDLFTNDLDGKVLNSSSIAQAISHFVKISPKSRFRILVSDPTAAIKEGHCLIDLSRKFSSFITIKKTHAEYQNTAFSLLMVDNKALIQRPYATQYHAIVNYKAVYECRQQLEFFNKVWDRSEIASEMRQLFI